MNDYVLGASLTINPSWKNPSGEWHVGYKLIYELLTDTLVSRLKVGLLASGLRALFIYLIRNNVTVFLFFVCVKFYHGAERKKEKVG